VCQWFRGSEKSPRKSARRSSAIPSNSRDSFTTACAQPAHLTMPIVFRDIRVPRARSRMKCRSQLSPASISERETRVSYLARIHESNPKMPEAGRDWHRQPTEEENYEAIAKRGLATHGVSPASRRVLGSALAETSFEVTSTGFPATSSRARGRGSPAARPCAQRRTVRARLVLSH